MKNCTGVLGFEYELFVPGGIVEENTRMEIVPNSRLKKHAFEKEIKPFWEKNKLQSMFNGDRARFEGFSYDEGELNIYCSEEKYSTHFFLRTTDLPKAYQAQLLGTAGILKTKDRKLPYGVKNSENSDQGGDGKPDTGRIHRCAQVANWQ